MKYEKGDYVYWKSEKLVAKVVKVTKYEGKDIVWCRWHKLNWNYSTHHRAEDEDFRLATKVEIILFGDKN